MFHDRFDGNVPHKGHLRVCLMKDKGHCEVEFRKTPDTTGDSNLLSTVNVKFSFPSMDRQVSHLFKLLSKRLEELNFVL